MGDPAVHPAGRRLHGREPVSGCTVFRERRSNVNVAGGCRQRG